MHQSNNLELVATVIQLTTMTKQEFFKRTGVTVSDSEFNAIHEVYCYCDVDKDEFCKLWCKMNAQRVKDAKVQRMIEKKDAAFKDALHKWFEKWHGQKFYDNYHTPIAYTKISTFEVQAMSHAGIQLEDQSLSDVHFKVGQYLGIYREL